MVYLKNSRVCAGAINISNSKFVALTMFSLSLPFCIRIISVSWNVMMRSLLGTPKKSFLGC